MPAVYGIVAENVHCPDENTLVALAEGGMKAHLRAAYARHLDECPSCRETVSSLVRLSSSASLASASGADNASSVDAALAKTIPSERPPAAASPVSVPPVSLAPADLAAGQLVAERYRLERIVGEGGLGTVWAATHVLTQKRVALKVTKFRFPELDKRLLREARISGIVQHPNIVDIHDVLQLPEHGALALVMDLMEGESLDRFLASRQRLTVDETLQILLPVLRALAAAHAVGIIHRDLKPANIFLARSASAVAGAKPVPMLLDFGLAKMTATEGVAAMTSVLTKEKQLLGTPHYMAPEQLYGEADIDARTDVWAVGSVIFECLAGARPLVGSSVGQLLRSLATREIPKLTTAVPGIPPELGALVDSMLTRDRALRPSSLAPIIVAAESLVAHPHV